MSKNNLLIFIAFLTVFVLNYDISKCQIFEIHDVNFVFTNSKTFDEDVLESAVAMSSTDQFSVKILIEDIYKLKKFYFDNGFFDVKVDTSVSYEAEDEEVSINFIISENKRYEIESISFNGLEKISPEARKLFSKIVTLKPKVFYNRSLIVKNTNEILDMLQNNGYMNARLNEDSGTVIHKYASSPDIVTVTLNFEGADTIYYFGKTRINISNNVYDVSRDILYKMIEYKEGDVYSKEKKLLSERDITRIPIVQSTRIVADSVRKNLHVDFTAEITLNKKHEIAPAVGGANIENRFYMSASVKYQNKYLLKEGRSLNLELNAFYNSIPLNRFELSAAITQPYLFNKKSSLTDKITVGLYNREDAKNYYLGNLTSMQYLFSENTFYRNGTLDLTEELVYFIYDDVSQEPITLLNTVISTTFIHDKTNNAFSPTHGFYHSITVGHSGFLSRLIVDAFDPDWYYSQYVQLGMTNKYYLSLGSPNTVLATKLIYNENFEYGSGERAVPIQSLYRYFSGGSNSLRGWKAKQNGMLSNTNDGGNFLLEGSLELREKLFPRAQNFSKNISMGYFVDYGNVWERHEDFRWDQVALAIGFGIRYDLVIGPIRLDFGFKLYDPRAADGDKWLFSSSSLKNKFALQFAIGQAF